MENFRSADGYVPKENEEFMSEKMVAYFNDKLLYMREKIRARDEGFSVDQDLQSLKEADLNDRATMEEEATLDLKNKARLNKLLQEIEVALNKIKNGDYGYCEDTDEPISVMRLDAMPTAIYSIEALKKMEKANGNRPI